MLNVNKPESKNLITTVTCTKYGLDPHKLLNRRNG